MNTTKMLIAIVVSFVVMFGLGGLVHMGIIDGWMKAHAGAAGDMSRKAPMMMYIALGAFILAVLMSYIYPKGVESENHIMEGLKFGVIMGILWTVPYSIILYGATTLFSLHQVAMGALVSIIVQGLGGLAIAMVYGKNVKMAKS